MLVNPESREEALASLSRRVDTKGSQAFVFKQIEFVSPDSLWKAQLLRPLADHFPAGKETSVVFDLEAVWRASPGAPWQGCWGHFPEGTGPR